MRRRFRNHPRICYNQAMNTPPRLPVLHQGEDLLVLDKPAGMATHAGGSVHDPEMMVSKLLEYR